MSKMSSKKFINKKVVNYLKLQSVQDIDIAPRENLNKGVAKVLTQAKIDKNNRAKTINKQRPINDLK